MQFTDIFKFLHPEETISRETADHILQAVFEKNGTTANEISLEVLTSYSNYRKDRYALQRKLLTAILVLFLLLPLLFLYPQVHIATDNTENFTGKTDYEILVDTPLPIVNVSATLDGRHLPVYENDYNKFTTQAAYNGQLKVTVTLINKQQATRIIGVENIDEKTPFMDSYQVNNKELQLFIKDDGTGVDYENIKILDLNGREKTLLRYDRKEEYIVIDYPDEAINIYVPDYAGNTLHLAISIKK